MPEKTLPQIVKPQVHVHGTAFVWPAFGYLGVGFLGYAVSVGPVVDWNSAWLYAWVFAWPAVLFLVCAKWIFFLAVGSAIAAAVFFGVDHVRTMRRRARPFR